MEWMPVDKSGGCLRTSALEGKQYEEISCLYPALGKTYLSWEHSDFLPAFTWMRDNYVWFPPLMCILYGLAIYYGQMFMKNREPWLWRNGLAGWNLFLSTFSTVGFWRMLPQLVHNVYYYGLWGQLCIDPEHLVGSSSTGVWCILFVASKIPEFGDTFWLVVNKKPVIFLHWYHHMSVLLCCWHSMVSKAPTGLFFGTMNYGVHSIMYFYYFLMAMKIKPKWYKAQFITVIQIAQMFAGIIITALAFVTQMREGDNCWSKPSSNMASMIMYASYFVLFLQFFFEKYGFTVRRQDAKKKL